MVRAQVYIQRSLAKEMIEKIPLNFCLKIPLIRVDSKLDKCHTCEIDKIDLFIFSQKTVIQSFWSH